MHLRQNRSIGDYLTSAVVADVRFRAETPFLTAAHRISRAFCIGRAVYRFGTFGERIRVGYRTSGTDAVERSRQVYARRVRTAIVRVRTFVDVCKSILNISRGQRRRTDLFFFMSTIGGGGRKIRWLYDYDRLGSRVRDFSTEIGDRLFHQHIMTSAFDVRAITDCSSLRHRQPIYIYPIRREVWVFYVPVHCLNAFPVNPGLHWHPNPPGVFVHMEFPPHRPNGPFTLSHSSMSKIIDADGVSSDITFSIFRDIIAGNVRVRQTHRHTPGTNRWGCTSIPPRIYSTPLDRWVYKKRASRI